MTRDNPEREEGVKRQRVSSSSDNVPEDRSAHLAQFFNQSHDMLGPETVKGMDRAQLVEYVLNTLKYEAPASMAVSNTPEYIVITDRDRRILWTNTIHPQLKREDVIGVQMEMFCDPEQRHVLIDNVAKCFETRKPTTYSIASTVPSIYYYDAKVLPINHYPELCLVITSDVTARHKAETERKRREDFQAMMQKVFLQFVNVPRQEILEKITSSIGHIGTFLKASIGFIYSVKQDDKKSHDELNCNSVSCDGEGAAAFCAWPADSDCPHLADLVSKVLPTLGTEKDQSLFVTTDDETTQSEKCSASLIATIRDSVLKTKALGALQITRINSSSEDNHCLVYAWKVAPPILDQQLVSLCIEPVSSFVERYLMSERTKVLEDRLVRSQKMEIVGLVAGGVAHDFNNILQAIATCTTLGLAEVDNKTEDSSSQLRTLLQEIQTASFRATHLTTQLLSFSKPMPDLPATISLDKVLSNALSMLRRIIPEAIDFQYQNHGDEDKTIRVSRTGFDQVLLNLVVNARDAIGDSIGTIKISLSVTGEDEEFPGALPLFPEFAKGRFVRIDIEDSGSGMTADVRKQLFEPFFTTKLVGTGLGMHVILQVLRQNNGCIFFETEVGKGSTFSILFHPADNANLGKMSADSNSNNATSKATSKASSVATLRAPLDADAIIGTGLTALVVDDDPVIRRISNKLVQQQGFQVYTAENGLKAVEVFTEHKDDIDVLIIDCIMPVMSGVEAHSKICQMRDIPTIFVSGYSGDTVTQDNELKLLDTPHRAFLSKPYKRKQLRETLITVLGLGARVDPAP